MTAVRHGYSRYTYGCRCEVCRAANAEYRRRYQAEKQLAPR